MILQNHNQINANNQFLFCFILFNANNQLRVMKIKLSNTHKLGQT